MKTIVDTLLSPRWIVPIVPRNQVLENQSIVIDKGHIIDLLPTEQAQTRYSAKSTFDLSRHAVMPGLINAHAHSPMTLMRGIADDLALSEWLNNHIWPVEKRWMDEDFIRDGTELAFLEMVRGGTTCFNENFFFCDVTAEATLAAGLRAMIGTEVINFPSRYAATMPEYLEKMQVFCQKWQNHPLIKPSIHPHSPYTVDDNSFLAVKEFADQHQLMIHLHLHETANEIEQSLQEYHKRPLRRLFDLGLVSERLQCIHMTQIAEEDWDILKNCKPQIVHCPESNLKLASGYCPVPNLLKAGIHVGLGTDGAASNNDLDMFGEMRTASLLAKGLTGDPTALNATAALELATLGGAHALGLSHTTGSLEVGKAADIIAIDLSHPNTQPLYHPISQIAYAANSRQVTDVWVAGRQLLNKGEFTTLDAQAILFKAEQWQQKIKMT